MPPVTIYTTPGCPYCRRAKVLLTSKGAAYDEIDATDYNVRQTMTERSGGRYTVPQIFIGSAHVGGCDDLYALDAKGELDPLLQS
jgi:glutaredoxin 3